MSWGASLRRRSSIEWSVRLVLAAAVGSMGYLSVIQSVAVGLPASRIENAYAMAPGNGRIAARLSEVLSGPEATPLDHARAAQIAKEALRDDPTAVEAVATLGMAALLRGDQDAAKRLFAYSQVLSRRDLRTQLWAIEDAVSKGDVTGALRHYDIALRTKKNAPDLLYPVLASAVADPSVRPEIARTIVGKPSWAGGFVDYISSNNPDPKAVAALFQDLQQAHFAVSEGASSTLLRRLLADGDVEDAWSYYTSIRTGVNRRRSRDARFTATIEDPSPFDWSPVSGAGISAAIQSDPSGGVFDFAASPSVGGTLLQQLQLLPRGDYVLQGRSTGIEQPPQSRPYWTLSCRGGRELGRINMPNSAASDGQFVGRFTVPADCPVQVLELVAQPSSSMMGVAGQIEQVLLRPIR